MRYASFETLLDTIRRDILLGRSPKYGGYHGLDGWMSVWPGGLPRKRRPTMGWPLPLQPVSEAVRGSLYDRCSFLPGGLRVDEGTAELLSIIGEGNSGFLWTLWQQPYLGNPRRTYRIRRKSRSTRRCPAKQSLLYNDQTSLGAAGR